MFHKGIIHKKRKSGKENRGFTLLEVLVSMLVLAVIIGPILGNIVQASRVNEKSRKMQDASTLGQNIMEGLKSEPTFEDVAKQLVYKGAGEPFCLFTSEDNSQITTRQVEYNASTHVYAPAGQSCISRAMDPTTGKYKYSMKENASNCYTFEMQNITFNNRKYCALVKYDASAYKREDEGDEEQYNDVEMPILPIVSDDHNAVVAVTYQDQWAKSTLKQMYNVFFNSTYNADNTIDTDDIANDMNRRFTIDINYDTAKNKYIVTGKFVYQLMTLIPESSGYTRTYDGILYQQEFTSLENVYFFFKPNLTMKNDEITVNNNLTGDAANLNLYLVEQEDDATLNSGTYQNLINQYNLKVDLSEAEPPRSYSEQYIYHTSIRTNLGSTIDGFDGTSRITYSSGIDPDKLNQAALIDRDKEERIYKISVDLYSAPDTGIGTFKDKDYLVTYTSSKGE